MYAVFSPNKIQGMIYGRAWSGVISIPHIKENSVLIGADMPWVCMLGRTLDYGVCVYVSVCGL